MAEEEYQNRGYVYVLSNPSMPGVVKVGRSKIGGKHRAQQIYTTGVPEPFRLEFEVMVDDASEVEALAHERLSFCRVNGSREFFRCEVMDAIWVVGEIWSDQVQMAFAPYELVWDEGDANWLAHRLGAERGINAHTFTVLNAIMEEMTVEIAAELWEKHQKKLRDREAKRNAIVCEPSWSKILNGNFA